MTRSHSRSNDIGIGEKSVAYWATRPKGTLVVFVHGFGSKSMACWSVFPQLLQPEVRTRGADLVFFGYDSLWTQTRASADDLRRLLDELASRPHAFINPLVDPAEARERGFAYRRIVIVAHSFGAVIARWALIMARRSWTKRCALVLFAPAHKGARAPKAALGLLGLLPKVGLALGAVAQYVSPTLTDLEPGSTMLTQLLEQTERQLAAGRADFLKAKYVVFGRKERVVVTETFASDPDPVSPWPKKGHTDVQSPAGDYREPLLLVLRAV